MSTETLDLLQLHCPPTEVCYRAEVFNALNSLVKAVKIRYYGVSVERVEEALKAMEYPHVQTVQVIFNCFRQRPAELSFEQALKRKVGVLARVPLASGMLTGKLTTQSTSRRMTTATSIVTARRSTMGETFSGVDYIMKRRSAQSKIRNPLRLDVRSRHLRHSRSETPGSGRRELRCIRHAGAF